MPEDYFEPIAARYETYWPELFAPSVVDPAVAFLAECAGAGRRGPLLWPNAIAGGVRAL